MYAHISRVDNKTFRVNTLKDEHDCGLVFNSKHVDSTWLTKHFLEQFRVNPTMSYKTFHEMTAATKFSEFLPWEFYRAKGKAITMLEGSVREQYTILEDYYK